MRKPTKPNSKRTTSSLPKATIPNLLGSSSKKFSPNARDYVSHELTRVSLGSNSKQEKINFGKPPSTNSRGSGSGSTSAGLANLIKQTSSSGASRLLGGGLLGLGISTLFSQVFDLFGGSDRGTQMPSLVRFTLPDARDETIYANQSGVSVNSSTADRTGQAGPGVYNNANNPATSGQASIVSAVRNALLTSSSLNDVIGEL